MTENERFGLVFAKTGSINSGTETFEKKVCHLWNLELVKYFSYFHFLKYVCKRHCVSVHLKDMQV